MGLLVADEHLDRFHESLERVKQDPAFFDRFYQRFLASSDEVAAMFVGVDLDRIKAKIRQSLLFTMLASDGNASARERLVGLGALHARRGVLRHHYDLWLDALLSVVEEKDPKFDLPIEQSWRAVLSVGIGIMTEAPSPA
jgi:hypothetical protein